MAETAIRTDAYRLVLPSVWRSGVVVSSPHSGRDYPEMLLRRTGLDTRQIRSSEDAFVDRLFDTVPLIGAPLLAAVAPRAWIDLNRGEEELDPALITGLRPQALNPRVSAGLGVVPRVVAGGRAIYSGKLDASEAEERIATHWRPYHARLSQLMHEAHEDFGRAVLFDVHSMPHEALEALGARPPEIVLGDRYGASADARIVALVEAAFQAEGLRVSRNAPFAGAYITQFYGRPSMGRHAVQIEIDRALYMDEVSIRPSPEFESFRLMMGRVMGRIIAGLGQESLSLAAE
jgi:N-formylglutamate amidohydrolase